MWVKVLLTESSKVWLTVSSRVTKLMDWFVDCTQDSYHQSRASSSTAPSTRAYDTAKQFAGEKPSILVRFCIAQAVAAGSVTVAYPFDTVRRRLMMMSGEKEKMYKGTMDC